MPNATIWPVCPECRGAVRCGVWGSGYFEARCIYGCLGRLYGIIGEVDERTRRDYRGLKPVRWQRTRPADRRYEVVVELSVLDSVDAPSHGEAASMVRRALARELAGHEQVTIRVPRVAPVQREGQVRDG